MCTRLEVWQGVGLSRQRHLFRVLSTHTGPTSLYRSFQGTPPFISREDPRFKRIGHPYPHVCHRWQLKLTPACAIILSSGFDGLGFVFGLNCLLNPIACRRGSVMATRTEMADPAVIYDGTDVQADWKRSCTSLRSGSQRHRHFVTCPSKHRHGATLFIRLFRETRIHWV